MNKKTICILSFFLMVSFSTGVFIQFLVNDSVSLSADDISFWQGLWTGCKNDLTITVISMILSLTIYTVPFVFLLITGQIFTLGFSAAYLLSVHPHGLAIVCTVLLPRCLIKVPACIALMLLSLKTAATKRKTLSQKIPWHLYAICAGIMICSSLLEAVLHLLIVSP